MSRCPAIATTVALGRCENNNENRNNYIYCVDFVISLLLSSSLFCFFRFFPSFIYPVVFAFYFCNLRETKPSSGRQR